MKRRTFLFMLFTIISSYAFADDEVEVTAGDLKFSCDLKTQTAKVVQGDYSSLNKVTIPSTVTCEDIECTVTEIGDYAFVECEKLRNIVFPTTLKIIQQAAFQGCRNIAKLQLPEGLEVIEKYAFYGCSMTEVVIPEGVMTICYWAFNSNSFLKKVELPSTLTSLEDNVFDMTNLNTVISHVTEPFNISEKAFMGTKAFLFVPEGTRGSYLAAEGWNSFPNIFEGERGEITTNGLNFVYGTLSDNAVLIKGNYTEMEKLDIPEVITVDEKDYIVTEIQDEAFAWCIFNEAVIPEGVVRIGARAFSENERLSKIVLPSTLKEIGKEAISLHYADSMSVIVCHMKEPLSVDPRDIGVKMSNIDNITGERYYWRMEYYYPDPILYVPEGTKTLYEAAEGWTGCSLIFEGDPLDVEYEGMNYVCATGSKEAMLVKGNYDGKDGIFKDINVPPTITVDDIDYTVTVIGENALSHLYQVNTITIPETVYAVCRRAFEYSRLDERFQMPKGLRIIGSQAFYSFDGFRNSYEPVEIPEGVEIIGDMALKMNVETIILPSTLKSVYYSAFGDDIKNIISHMTMPCRLSYNYNNGIRMNYTLYVPKGCADIYREADIWKDFKEIQEGEIGVVNVDGLYYRWETGNNTALLIEGDYKEFESVTIPETIDVRGEKCTVTTIGKWSFSDCHKLQSVKFPSTLKVVEFRAFWECTKLSELNLPGGLEEIDDGAFYSCIGLKQLRLPEGLRSIGNTAFKDCSNLELIELPSTLEKIDFQAFSGIDYDVLTTVNSHIKHPFPVETNVFEVVPGRFTNAELHVPNGTLEEYKDYVCWNEFKIIIDDLQEELGDVNDDYEVDVNDFMLIFRYIYGDTSLKVKENDDDTDYDINFYEADMNGDNKIDIADLVMLANKLLK